MRILLDFLSLIWIALGVMLILHTEMTRNYLRALFAKTQTRVLAAVPLTIGLVLLAGSFSQPEMFWLLFILGLLAVSKGIYFVFGPAIQIKSLQDWWFERADERALRLWGIICLLLGVTVLFYVVRT